MKDDGVESGADRLLPDVKERQIRESRNRWMRQYRKLRQKVQEQERSLARRNRLLDNAYEQNRLLTEERNALLAEMRSIRCARKASLEKTVDVLENMMRLRPDQDSGRMEAILGLCTSVAKGLDFSEEDVTVLGWAARLHELASVTVPDGVLARNKENRTENESRLLEQMPLLSARIIAGIDGLSGVVTVVRHMGEKYDGSGVPKGWKGKRIPAGSRVLAAVAACVSQQRQHPETGLDGILMAMEEGHCFDPEVLAEIRCQAEGRETEMCGDVERVRLYDLRPGMILAAGIHSKAGAMLLPEGTRITAKHLDQVAAYSGAGPLVETAYIRKQASDRDGAVSLVTA